GDAFDLREAGEWEVVLNVHRPLGVVRKLLCRVLADAEALLSHTEREPPAESVLNPAIVPLLVGAWHDEVLHLHLLELAVAEDEVAGRDLVAERAADLGDAEGELAAGSGEEVVNVGQD